MTPTVRIPSSRAVFAMIGAAPFPVGVIPAQGTSRLALPDTSEKLFFNVSRLAVSFEKAPSNAGDAPAGAYALIGNCVKVW